jgi:hypothetical protein
MGHRLQSIEKPQAHHPFGLPEPSFPPSVCPSPPVPKPSNPRRPCPIRGPRKPAAPRRASRPSFPPLQATPLSPTDIRALLHLTPHVTEYAVPTQSPPLLYKETDHLPYRLAHPKLTPHHRRPPISSSSRSIRPFQSTVSLPRRRSCCRLPSLDLSPWGSELESDHPPGLLQGLRWRPRGASAPSGRRI